MRFALRILLFLLASILEVEVKADGLATWTTLRKPLQYPEGCMEAGQGLCTIRSLPATKVVLKENDFLMTLGSDSAVIRDEAKVFQLAKGSVFIDTKVEVSVKALHGDIRLVGSAILSESSSEGTLVRSLDGSISFRGLGHQEWTSLSPGYEVRMQKVNQAGRSKVSFPLAIDLRQTLVFLAHVNTGPANQFEQRWRDLAQTWKSAVAGASEMHAKLYDREVASQRDQLNSAKKRREAQRKEQDFYREMMWKRHFE